MESLVNGTSGASAEELAQSMAAVACCRDRSLVLTSIARTVGELFPDLSEDEARSEAARALSEAEEEDPLFAALRIAEQLATIARGGLDARSVAASLLARRFPELSIDEVSACMERKWGKNNEVFQA